MRLLSDTHIVADWIRPRPHLVPGYDYLTGYRGFVVIQMLLWTFTVTFVPSALSSSSSTSMLKYSNLLRDILSVLLWNEYLIYSSIVYLSARIIALPFLANPTTATIASCIFRRTITLVVPVSIAIAVIQLTLSQTGTIYITAFKATTRNAILPAPIQFPSTALSYFNAVFDLFWTTRDFASQAGVKAFPTNTLWIVSVLYQQSYTVYMSMIIIPYTRPAWRIKAYLLFIFTAWWVQSWAWYSMTGLMVADIQSNMDFFKSQRGWKLHGSLSLPYWAVYVLLVAIGLTMQYIFTVWKPEWRDIELKGHTGLYYTASYNSDPDPLQPQARDDIYLIILGFNLILESTKWLQSLFPNPIFLYSGQRSYSIYLSHSLIIFLLIPLHQSFSFSLMVSNVIIFLIYIASTIFVSECVFRIVEVPTRRLGLACWDFLLR